MPRSSRHLTTMSFFSIVGIALFVLESFIPMPLPFLKIGLANVSTLLALYTFGLTDVLIIVLIRVVAGSLLVGSIFSPGFLLAFAGGVSSALVMSALKRMTGDLFSIFGISLVGAFVHVIAQMFIVVLLFVQSTAVLILFPMLLSSALIGGTVVGWIAVRLHQILERMGSFIPRAF
ncbi:MAG TPA: Gx transporter family protein [Bacteroidota bacterium]